MYRNCLFAFGVCLIAFGSRDGVGISYFYNCNCK